ncbi:MAG: phosphatase PAP2 family protein [Myxococcota bacterium]|nr:phosphatase PAP2 family protein [Myxococcota bacterium]MDW8363158.1 phosphatase PAP2 family protein [Myxococcales bacterium]
MRTPSSHDAAAGWTGESRLGSAGRILDAVARNAAVQDWVLLAFHAYMLARVLVAPASSERTVALAWAVTLFGVTAATVFLVRGSVLRQGPWRALVYRIGVFAPAVCSYFSLRWLLPSLRPDIVDDTLLAIDEALFGTTPAIWVESFWSPALTEWFAFFYYSYFFVLGLNLLPVLFFGRGAILRELMVGALVVCTLGHVGYTLVPAYGPYHHMSFATPLEGGLFWHLVLEAVRSAGAMLDVFPSLHTAYPTFFAIFAVRHRRTVPYRWLWPLSVLVAVNIVPATMVLRWHYAIDIVAGIALAAFAAWAAARVSAREASRTDSGRQPTWERLWWPSGG